jgi:predicted nuclease of predicted toxin-antitoxin system
MRLLLDANLSWRMINTLKEHFDDCFHVDNIGLEVPARDTDIWNYAKANGLTIVTNDEDFVDLVNLKGFPPKVILLRTANQSRLYLTNLLILRKDEIKQLAASADLGLLEIVDKKS